MLALVSFLKQEHEEKLWRRYVSAVLWRIDRVYVGKGFPTFEDSIKPEDTRTAEEVKTKILTGLRGEVKDVNGFVQTNGNAWTGYQFV